MDAIKIQNIISGTINRSSLFSQEVGEHFETLKKITLLTS